MASPSFPFANTYARLPDRFFARLDPTAVAAPSLIRINEPLARDLGLDPEALATPEGVAVLAGNRIPDGAEPLAMAYAGFQFGNWVPQLGDGRALLLGEVVAEDGERRDLQLKGSGPTPFSRRGDGRAGLGPVLREYVVSEAMHRLGVPTTRALAAVQTGEPVYREEPVPGAVLTRVARSHVRVGTFQFFAARNDEDALRTLVDWVIARHDPDLAGEERPALSLFRRVLERQAQLVAKWQGLGFIHGVMNTDNTTVSGETIDYGPCAFMDTYHPETVYSSIDHAGRYAYCNQPPIAHWNLASLAQALLPLFVAEHGGDEDAAVQAARDELDRFPSCFESAQAAVFRRKLGLTEARDEDAALAADWLDCMAGGEADFTLAFRHLGESLDEGSAGQEGELRLRSLFADQAALDPWLARYRARIAQETGSGPSRREAMRAANPLFIPRNHLVEEAITAALGGDFAPFHELVETLERPFDDAPTRSRYALPPRPEQVVRQTFCGT